MAVAQEDHEKPPRTIHGFARPATSTGRVVAEDIVLSVLSEDRSGIPLCLGFSDVASRCKDKI